MSRRTLGTKGKGPVKPGNWGYGYQIERFNKEDIFDDDRENTWYNSCYNCVNCIGNICNKYNCTIRHLGSTKYRTCSSYKNIETSKNNIELELEKAYYDSLIEWYEEGEETDIIAKEYRTKSARKNIIKNDTVNDICKAQRKIPKKDIMNLSYLSLKHNISVFSLFLEIGNEMKNKGNEHILQCKKQNNKYKYFDASKVFYEKINEIFNITDIDLLFLTKDKKRDIVYSFILSQNIVVRQISKNYYQYFIEDKDNEEASEKELSLFLLKKTNNDVVGILEFNDRIIYGPIVQTPNNDYYVRKNINKEYANAGIPFVSTDGNIDSKNVVIYGHSSKWENIIFTSLMSYTDQSYYKKHDTFKFITEDKTRIYQIFGVMNIDLNDLNDSLEFTQTEWDSTNSFNAFISDSINRGLYKTGVSVNKEDRLMTLVTCDTRDNNKRIVILAKLHE